MSPAHSREIEKKIKLLRADYGGMMTIKQLCRELNVCRNSVYAWVREHNVPGNKVGRIIKYETDQVARVIVDGRGMVQGGR